LPDKPPIAVPPCTNIGGFEQEFLAGGITMIGLKEG
jgi:hypothetical protein